MSKTGRSCHLGGFQSCKTNEHPCVLALGEGFVKAQNDKHEGLWRPKRVKYDGKWLLFGMDHGAWRSYTIAIYTGLEGLGFKVRVQGLGFRAKASLREWRLRQCNGGEFKTHWFWA